MSVELAFRRAGVSASTARAEAPRAERAMIEYDITTQARGRDFLAQVLHESGALHFFEELASGQEYEGRADLGNTHPGDGRRYKGRGPIQLTGRANYRWAGQRLHLPLEAQPTLAARHDIGWRIAGLYWQSHGLNELADRGMFVTITRRINGGLNGLASRLHYRAVVGRVDCRPDPYRNLTPTEARWVREYERLKHADRNLARRVQLRAAMRRQRKVIWRAAQPRSKGGDGKGWTHAHRRERYRVLLRFSS